MGSILERLLAIVTPLLFAATSSKKSGAPKTKRARTARLVAKTARSKAKPTAPARKVPAKSKTPARKMERRGAPSRKAQEQAPAKAGPASKPSEPQVKPVAPAGRAILLTPENGKYADSVYPKFRWLSVGGANRYEVAWGERPDLSGANSLISVATGTTVPEDKPLRVGETYYWRVRGGNEGGWGPWSATASFQVLEGPPPP